MGEDTTEAYINRGGTPVNTKAALNPLVSSNEVAFDMTDVVNVVISYKDGSTTVLTRNTEEPK